jgi:hypothetical protein
MKRFIFPVILPLLLSFALIAGGNTSLPTNKYVKYEVSMKEKSFKASSTGTLLISLHPNKGIHINLNPPISITFDSTDVIVKAGSPAIPKVDTVLNAAKPIRLPITLSNRVKPGKVSIKGTILYYYCSDADGWCSRCKQPFELAINVVR